MTWSTMKAYHIGWNEETVIATFFFKCQIPIHPTTFCSHPHKSKVIYPQHNIIIINYTEQYAGVHHDRRSDCGGGGGCIYLYERDTDDTTSTITGDRITAEHQAAIFAMADQGI